jgi:hypothetical protein
MPSKFHLAKDAFALQLSLQRLQCLINVIISNKYLHAAFPFFQIKRSKLPAEDARQAGWAINDKRVERI